jgi:uncharacterized protein
MRKKSRYVLSLHAAKQSESFAERLRVPHEDLSKEGQAVIAQGLDADYTVRHVGGERFYLQGEVRGQTRSACARCLAAMEREVAHRLGTLLLPDRSGEDPVETEKNPEEDIALRYNSNMEVALLPFLEEEFFLHYPLKPLCREDCRGLCPRCGANRNETRCAHEGEEDAPFDPRLLPLRMLRPRLARKDSP